MRTVKDKNILTFYAKHDPVVFEKEHQRTAYSVVSLDDMHYVIESSTGKTLAIFPPEDEGSEDSKNQLNRAIGMSVMPEVLTLARQVSSYDPNAKGVKKGDIKTMLGSWAEKVSTIMSNAIRTSERRGA